MIGVTVHIDSAELAKKGTSDRLNEWKGIDLTGRSVEVRGGSSYVSLAEVQVLGRKSGELP